MILKDIGIVLFPGIRSKAYIQMLIKTGLIPSVIYLVDKKIKKYSKKFEKYKNNKYIDIFETEEETLTKKNICFKKIKCDDINSEILIKALKQEQIKYIIYTGGGILKENILSIGKEFIHIHPGEVPWYRGSTCFYYSILSSNKVGLTCFLMRKELDTGPYIKKKSIKMFKLKQSQGYDIDIIYDAYWRSTLLKEVLYDYSKNMRFIIKKQNFKQGTTYFIIHPVLKHLAILKCMQ